MDVAASVCSIASDKGSVTCAEWDMQALRGLLQTLCGLPKHLCGLRRRYVG